MMVVMTTSAGMAGSAWSDERQEQLRKLWADGLSATAIANIINGELDPDERKLTRNAVIGKAHRLELSGRPKPVGVRRSRSQHRDVRSRIIVITNHRKLVEEASDLAPQPKEDGSLVSVFDLGPSICHFPIGDPRENDFAFCGRETAESTKKYCPHHAAMMTVRSRLPALDEEGRAKDGRRNNRFAKPFRFGTSNGGRGM